MMRPRDLAMGHYAIVERVAIFCYAKELAFVVSRHVQTR